MPEDAQALEAPEPAAIATADRTVGPMQVVLGLRRLAGDAGRLFVVVGVFDGIHRGHSYLLGQLRRHAGRRAARPTVITFDAHPDEVLVGEAPPLICDPDERLMRLSAAGVAVTVIEHFDQALRMTPYDGFIRMITERTPLAGLLMTPEAAFGHERRGTPDALSELGARDGFEVVVVPSFTLEGAPVSSSAVRSARTPVCHRRRHRGAERGRTGQVQPAGRAASRRQLPGRHRAVPRQGGFRIGPRGSSNLERRRGDRPRGGRPRAGRIQVGLTSCVPSRSTQRKGRSAWRRSDLVP
ncbi:MAG: hypothetical protein E6I45_01640 [Chloroflexi bacterium]|nr:MAG: hypothetical protein E6I45_01640 [Chloroflexota bacterium]